MLEKAVYHGDMPAMEFWNRRDFLKFIQVSGLVALNSKWAWANSKPDIESLSPSLEDKLSFTKGFESQVLLRWQDRINPAGDKFGFNCDFTCFIPFNPAKPDDGLLWVNHEYPTPLFVSGSDWGAKKTKQQVDLERDSVGGSIVRIKKDSNGRWRVQKNDSRNRRITAKTKIPFVAPRPIEGSSFAIGTLANCSGGLTPWRSILTCEENFHDYFGMEKISASTDYGWAQHYRLPPQHYGWVVEVDPFTGQSKKLTALGRFAHEGATVTLAKDGRCVVYSGDDANDQCIYKFIADRPGSLETGKLYVANTKKGRWISLQREDHKVLKKNFRDQLDVLIHCRKAAAMVGGTPQDRPEDIEIHPHTKTVVVALTNNSNKNNYHGSLLSIVEKNADPLALEFTSHSLLAGGLESGFACPDNLAFDSNGNLWMTTDMSTKLINKPPYQGLGNNALFLIPMTGDQAGKAIRVANSPHGAELTGPWLTPDEKHMFLSVQHPGEDSASLDQLTSHWPDGGQNIPKPSVVSISLPGEFS